MGLFDALAKQALGGVLGGQQAEMLSDLLRDAGGLQGMRDRFKEAGMEETFMSWVGVGANRPILPEQLKAVLGPETLQALSSKVGVGAAMVIPMLGQFLPQIIDKLTPNGTLPETAPSIEQLRAALGDVLGGSGLGGLFGGKS